MVRLEKGKRRGSNQASKRSGDAHGEERLKYLVVTTTQAKRMDEWWME